MIHLIKKWTLILLLTTGFAYLAYESFNYYQARYLRHQLPLGAVVAGVDVSHLTLPQAEERIRAHYARPVYLYHRDERVEIDPASASFVLDIERMLAETEQLVQERDEWLWVAGYLLNRPVQPARVPLIATHDREALLATLEQLTGFLDKPARPPQMSAGNEAGGAATLQEGQPGYVTDIEASLPAVEAALYRPERREAHLIVEDQEPPPRDFALLEQTIRNQLQAFNGFGSVFVMDLQTGEELSINGDVAISGLSILKIAIFVEAYRALDNPPNEYQQGLFYDTAARSSNFGANLLLHIVAGENNTYRGADILTESMRRLGLVNTFIAVPYDANPPPHRQTTYVTPANSRNDPSQVRLEQTMQTTAEEIGTLLSMIYYCAQGGGPLLAVYPGEITPEECQAIIDLMIENREGTLINFGVPHGTPVSHKHGWIPDTHGDAGIVFTPGGDFVLVEYLHRPGSWLVADTESFPLLREIARTVYNYFNYDDPYLGNALLERERFPEDDPFFQAMDAAEAAGRLDEFLEEYGFRYRDLRGDAGDEAEGDE